MSGGRSALASRAAALVVGGAAALAARAGGAQTIETSRPRTFVVGTPPGARMEGLDAARTGAVQTGLPSARLRVDWRASTGAPIDQGPLVDARGVTYIVGARGEVIAFSRAGVERWRARTGVLHPGAAALLSDDTVLFVDESGTAVAVRDGIVRWRSRFGRPADSANSMSTGPTNPVYPAPMPLDDGGAVVATSHELAVLDCEGHERARTTVPEPMASPLIAASGRVVVVGGAGAVWTWVPGAPEPSRVGAFGSPVEGSAALADDHTLFAVVAGGATLASVDLRTGALGPRVVAPGGGVWMGGPAMHGRLATMTLFTPTQELAVTLDSSGQETARYLLAPRSPRPRADGGGAGLRTEGPSTPTQESRRLLVDRSGSVFFATSAGNVGALSPADGSVEILADLCPSRAVGAGGDAGPDSPVVAGLAPLGPAAVVVACRSGSAVAILGDTRNTPPDHADVRGVPQGSGSRERTNL